MSEGVSYQKKNTIKRFDNANFKKNNAGTENPCVTGSIPVQGTRVRD